jgi:DNA-binding HxlR family transcriptional regulator/putative sterol carrier protein
MAKRSYDQYCPAARALDVLGERWTLLVVRELLLGPKRYTDLLGGLPGIGPNVLAERLRHLQDAGIVKRGALPPPAASNVYQLTELGEALRPVVYELTRWGLNLMGAPKSDDNVRLTWLMRAMEGTFRPEAARGVHETYEFRIDGEVFHVQVDDAKVAVRAGQAADPACVVTTDLMTFMAVGSRRMTGDESVEGGLATVEGDPEAIERSIQILGPHLDSLGPPVAGGILGAVQVRLRPEATSGLHESYEFRVDNEVFHVRADDGEVEVRPGPAKDPAFVFTTDLGTLLAFAASELTPEQAVADGRAKQKGDAAAGERLWAIVDAGEPAVAA